MSEISAMAASALAMTQSDVQQQIEMNLLRKSAQAEREVADMIMENGKRMEALAKNSIGGIDLYA